LGDLLRDDSAAQSEQNCPDANIKTEWQKLNVSYLWVLSCKRDGTLCLECSRVSDRTKMPGLVLEMGSYAQESMRTGHDGSTAQKGDDRDDHRITRLPATWHT
jgi:hypothetical protein